LFDWRLLLAGFYPFDIENTNGRNADYKQPLRFLLADGRLLTPDGHPTPHNETIDSVDYHFSSRIFSTVEGIVIVPIAIQ
jgi:hypothetical protein